MRRRLERALAGSGHQGDAPLPRIYSAGQITEGRVEEGVDQFPGRLVGEELKTPKGNVLRYRWSVPLEELTHAQDFEGASEGAGVLSVLLENPSLENFDLRRALFLDTETTGLAGGTGTYVILLGLGWLEGEDFVVEQLFLRDFGEETALLYRAGEIARQFDVLVTFNGRRYDLPLLDTRLVMNRLPDDLSSWPHLDLLYPARMLYSGTFEDCRLQTLEKELMGQYRNGDIPGADIPSLYFDYLTDGDISGLVKVFEHNFLDVVTLVTLSAHFLHLCQKPELDPRAMAGLGRLHGRRGNREMALQLLEQARSRRAATYRDLRDLGFLYKRNEDHSKALEVWKALISRQMKVSSELAFDVIPYVEAAKHYEHRSHDFARALELTEGAIEQAMAASNGQKSSRRVRDQLAHRAGRLRRKLENE
jgi:uncharacterized protein YprB with RNaseH-like and TPR domain